MVVNQHLYNIYDRCMYIYNIYIYMDIDYIYINTHHFLKLGGHWRYRLAQVDCPASSSGRTTARRLMQALLAAHGEDPTMAV